MLQKLFPETETLVEPSKLRLNPQKPQNISKNLDLLEKNFPETKKSGRTQEILAPPTEISKRFLNISREYLATPKKSCQTPWKIPEDF